MCDVIERWYQIKLEIGERIFRSRKERQCMSDEEVAEMKRERKTINFMG